MKTLTEPQQQRIRDMLRDMAWQLDHLARAFDPDGKNPEWGDARELVREHKVMEKVLDWTLIP